MHTTAGIVPAWKEIALESLNAPQQKLLEAAASVVGPLYRVARRPSWRRNCKPKPAASCASRNR
ncbi:hypothetical protein, partial [Methylogaea oryzae]|uniref:hypothetical protein n=1 Tax=Methylogaea oryzae TaxID=1295382 RepID=UPI001C3F3C06